MLDSRDPAAEAENDWHAASVEFAIDILEGRIDFVRNIDPKSYWRLEGEWLDDAKLLLAHRVWLRRGRGWGEREKMADYLQVCTDFASTLCGPNRKASKSDFAAVEKYIQEKYFYDGSISVEKKETAALVRAKAQRLHDFGVGGDADSDWLDACDYVNAFYSKILEVVEEPNPTKTAEIFGKITGMGGRYRNTVMVNMFEAIIFRYFVKSSIAGEFSNSQSTLSTMIP